MANNPAQLLAAIMILVGICGVIYTIADAAMAPSADHPDDDDPYDI